MPLAALTARTDAQLIESAQSAAPAGVAKHSTVATTDAKRSMRALRAGTNDFTCLAANPETPGPDAMCANKASMAWMHAMMTHAAPPAGKAGLIYMLTVGTDASNADTYATRPVRT